MNNEILFIDGRNLGHMVNRTLKELSEDDVLKIADTFRSWRGTIDTEYQGEEGFCKAASTEEVKENEHILTPGRYVGLSTVEEDNEPFELKMERITTNLMNNLRSQKELEDQIRKSLEGLGYGV